MSVHPLRRVNFRGDLVSETKQDFRPAVAHVDLVAGFAGCTLLGFPALLLNTISLQWCSSR